MRPLRIEFQAFGPYAEKETVDFEKLASKGVFLICGKTGSGKTMLLDAMTFALYGDSSGNGNGREKIENLRCTFSDPKVPTYVRFEFENQGQLYLFERTCTKKRTNYAVSCVAKRKKPDGEWEVLFENPKDKELKEKAEKIVGLSYDQFRQVIVLPQGQFEKLLTSKSDDKEAILTKIFRTGKWGEIADRFYKKAEERKEALDEIKKEIDTLLQEEGCEKAEDLAELIKDRKKEHEELESAFDEVGIKGESEKLREMIGLYERLHEEETALSEKEVERPQRDRWEEQLRKADSAEGIRVPIHEVVEAASEKKTREEEKQEAEKQAGEAAKEAGTAQEELREHIAGESRIQDLQKQELNLAGKRKDYEQIDKIGSALESQKCIVNEAVKEEEKCAKELGEAESDRERLSEEYHQANVEYNSLFDRYASGQIFEIRDRLVENKPCPICGVIVDHEHYRKAKEENETSDNGDRVTKEILDRFKKGLDEKDTLLKEAIERCRERQKTHNEKAEKLTGARTELASISGQYDAIKEGLIEGIDSVTDLESEIKKCRDMIDEYQNRRAELERREREARENSVRLNTQSEEAEKALHKANDRLRLAEEALDRALKGSMFQDREEAVAALMDPEDRNRLQKDLNTYDAEVKDLKLRCDQLRSELESAENKSEEFCREELDRLEDVLENHRSERHKRELRIADLEEKEKIIRQKSAGTEDASLRAEEELVFAKKLRGDTGIGLHRYVLGIMLAEVVEEANRMLEKVHGGRYRLYRADEKGRGSNKRGLELKVHDSYSDEQQGRFVGTMSGGEKFLASLALAIGMSTVAQKKGIKIEALFIDEGFGSLDEDSIDDAMDILKGLQESSGMVGIISHVKLMQDSIPTKLIVEPGENGSYIRTSIG